MDLMSTNLQWFLAAIVLCTTLHLQIIQSFEFNSNTAEIVIYRNMNLTDLPILCIQSENIRSVDLSYNNIHILPTDILSTKKNVLTMLSIANNHIECIHKNAFQQLYKLEILDLSFNNIFDLDDNIFSKMGQLRNISLRHNKIQFIDEILFSKLELLMTIDLSENQITYVDSKSFLQNTKLENVFLNKNKLKCISPLNLTNSNVYFKIIDNAWICNCQLSNIIKQLNLVDEFQSDLNELTCMEDKEIVKWFFIENNTQCDSSQNTSTAIECPNEIERTSFSCCNCLGDEITEEANCTFEKSLICNYKFYKMKLIIKRMSINDLSANNFKNIETELIKYLSFDECSIETIDENTFGNMINLDSLDLQNNNIEIIYNNTFTNNTDLTLLNLKNNCLRTLNSMIFKHLTKIITIELSYNNISNVNNDTFLYNINIKEVFLNNNNLTTMSPLLFNTSVLTLNLLDNPWHCGCHLKNLTVWFSNKSFSNIPKCAEPFKLKDRPWNNISSVDFSCPHDIIELSNLSIIFITVTLLLILIALFVTVYNFIRQFKNLPEKNTVEEISLVDLKKDYK